MTRPFVDDNPKYGAAPSPPATVVVGELSPDGPEDDQNAYYTEVDDPKSIWTDYLVNNRIEHDGHRYMMGVTHPDGFRPSSGSACTVAFVQLAAPTALWIADWTASRLNVPPDIPDPDAVPAGWVLLDKIIEPAQIGLMADGETPVYRISGTYFYGHCIPGETEDLTVYPVPPWLEQDRINRTISRSNYKDGIIAQRQGVIGGGAGNLGRPNMNRVK